MEASSSQKRKLDSVTSNDDEDLAIVSHSNSENTKKSKKDNVDLFMHCEEEDLTNSQLQSYRNSVQEYNDAVKKIDVFQNSQDWDSREFDSGTNTFTLSKVVEVRGKNNERKVAGSSSPSSNKILQNSVQSQNNSLHNFRLNPVNKSLVVNTVNTSSNKPLLLPNANRIVLKTSNTDSSIPQVPQEPQIILNEAPCLAVKTILVNQITGQVYGEILNPANQGINPAAVLQKGAQLPVSGTTPVLASAPTSNQTPDTKADNDGSSQNEQPSPPESVKTTIPRENNEKRKDVELLSSEVSDVNEDDISENWASGNLDALKLTSLQLMSSASFENLPPGVKTSIPFLHDYDKVHAIRLKHHLEVKLASADIFGQDTSNITQWMMDAGLLKESLTCLICHSPMNMIPTVNSDNIDNHMWKCTKCSRTKSIRHSSFFDFHPVKLQSLLVLVYHWAFQSDTLKLFMTVQSSMASSPRPLPILVNFWLSIRRLCTKMIADSIFNKPFGGSGKHIIIDSIVIPKGIIILGAHETETADVRFKVISPSDYKSYKGTLQLWIEDGTEVYTNKENIKRSLNMKNVVFHPLKETEMKDISINITKYLTEEVGVLFSAEFFSSPIISDTGMDKAKGMRQKTLFNVSLKNTMKETIELMQLALDEVMWRSNFGKTEAEAFVNILKAISIQEGDKDFVNSKAVILAPPVSVARTASSPAAPVIKEEKNPKKNFVSIAPKQTIFVPAPTPKFKQVCLENYYYASYQPQADDLSVVTIETPQMKCHICDHSCADNVGYMKHVLLHIDNYRTQSSDLANLTQCKFCFRTFNTPFNMQSHLDEVHLSKDPNIQLCRICEVRFSDTEKLSLHMRVYHKENEMPYYCEVCLFRSSFYSHVVNHFNVMHRATNKLLCPYCLRIFSVVSKVFYFKHLLRHQTRKSLSQKGRCKQCCLSFILESDLKQHVQRAHSDTSSLRLLNSAQITKIDLPSKTMIPHPCQVFNKGRINKTSVTPPVVPKPKVQVRDLNLKGIVVSEVFEQYACIECGRPIGQNHFLKYVYCSQCSYSTFCLKSYSEHMIKMHSNRAPRKIMIGKHNTMYCACQYSTFDMVSMAAHLVKCGRKTCYPARNHIGMGVFSQSATFPPLVVLDEDLNQNNSNSHATLPDNIPSAALATGLSLSTQLAANNRSDAINKNSDSSQDESSKMLSVLGLMRTKSGANPSKDCGSVEDDDDDDDEEEERRDDVTEVDGLLPNIKIKKEIIEDPDDEIEEEDDDDDVGCLMTMPVEVSIKEESLDSDDENQNEDGVVNISESPFIVKTENVPSESVETRDCSSPADDSPDNSSKAVSNSMLNPLNTKVEVKAEWDSSIEISDIQYGCANVDDAETK